MHHFQHGIWRPSLRTVGACFGLPLKQEQEDEASAADYDLHNEHEGCLLPVSGEEEEGDAEIYSLQPEIGQHLEHMGILPPAIRGDDEEGILPPIQRGDEDNIAANNDLHAYSDVGLKVDEKAEKEDLLPTIQGLFDPFWSQQSNVAAKPNLRQAEAKKIGAPYGGTFFSHLVDYLEIDVVHDWKQLLLTFMHGEIGGHGKACMANGDVVIVHAKPRVDPKVKKKTSLLLCLSIDMPFHPGEYGHDGNPPYHHHKPYSSLSLYIESLHPPTHSFVEAPSSSDFSLLVILSKEGKAAYEVLKVATSRIKLPFIPLRGREGYQAHERNFKFENPYATMKRKTMRMQMRLFYLSKDLLDPG